MAKKRMVGKHFMPRLSVDIYHEQDTALGKLIPWGLKTRLFQGVVDGVIEILSLADDDEERLKFIGAIMKQRKGFTSYELVTGNARKNKEKKSGKSV